MFSRTTGRIDDRWQAFMKFQIARARQCFADAEAGVDHLDSDARWPVWSALILYRCARYNAPWRPTWCTLACLVRAHPVQVRVLYSPWRPIWCALARMVRVHGVQARAVTYPLGTHLSSWTGEAGNSS